MSRLELILDPWQLESMDDYSRSLPSGTTIGKFWKRAVYAPNPVSTAVDRYVVVDWRVGCYAWEEPDPQTGEPSVRILWFDVVLRHGPAPLNYDPPDWSNFGQWKEQPWF